MNRDSKNLCETFHMHEIDHGKKEGKTLLVVIITIVMMIAEIAAGLIYGSMALLSDGIHMGTHTLALAITLIAYVISRKHARNSNFTFGTGKVGVLGGYTSAIALLIAAMVMGYESVERLLSPRQIGFNESIIIAFIGLVVNVVSAIILAESHDHRHHNDHDSKTHEHKHEDHNLKAAYLHVIADALTSVLAIIALFAGKYYNAIWLDPVVGIVGGIVVGKWAIGLLSSTGKILLDYDRNNELKDNVVSELERDGSSSVIDIHIWRVDDNNRAAMISVKDPENLGIEHFRKCIEKVGGFVHVTVEVF